MGPPILARGAKRLAKAAHRKAARLETAMASNTLTGDARTIADRPEPARRQKRSPLLRVLDVLASLRLTVLLFALAIMLIFAGTLAQVNKDIWEVMGLYFRAWVAWIPLQVFFPASFFP